MKNITILITYALKPYYVLKAIFTKPAAFILVMPVIAIEALSIETKAAGLLFILFWIDFATGIGASTVEFYKHLTPKKPGATKRYVIESSKLKLSGVKFIIYGLCLLIAKGIQYVFIPTEFKLHDNVNSMTITVMVAAFLCAIEVYSIVFENFKRMGFDVVEWISKGVKQFKTIKKKVS